MNLYPISPLCSVEKPGEWRFIQRQQFSGMKFEGMLDERDSLNIFNFADNLFMAAWGLTYQPKLFHISYTSELSKGFNWVGIKKKVP